MSTGLPRRGHVYIDETKAHDYILVGVWIAASDIVEVRKQVALLRPSGSRRLHFKKLDDARRRLAIGVIAQLPIRIAFVRVASEERDPRTRSLAQLLALAVGSEAIRVVLETDANVVAADVAVARRGGIGDAVLHLRAHEEPLLWLSDAVAWCIQRGGDWRESIAPLLTPVDA